MSDSQVYDSCIEDIEREEGQKDFDLESIELSERLCVGIGVHRNAAKYNEMQRNAAERGSTLQWLNNHRKLPTHEFSHSTQSSRYVDAVECTMVHVSSLDDTISHTTAIAFYHFPWPSILKIDFDSLLYWLLSRHSHRSPSRKPGG